MSIIEEVDAPGGEDPDAVFATAAEVAARLGRELTEAETAHVEMLLSLAASAIAAACDKDDAWAASLAEDVPNALRITSIEMVVRVLQNPGGVRSRSKTLGQFSTAESFADKSAELALTDAEERRVRRAVFGTGSGSAKAQTLIDELVEDE